MGFATRASATDSGSHCCAGRRYWLLRAAGVSRARACRGRVSREWRPVACTVRWADLLLSRTFFPPGSNYLDEGGIRLGETRH
jgi:hypothetical protein